MNFRGVCPGCQIPDNTKMPALVYKIERNVTKLVTISCPMGSALMHCGLENVHTERPFRSTDHLR